MTSRWPHEGAVPAALLFFAAAAACAQGTTCRIEALPERVVENRGFEVTVAYRGPRGEARLNCELKNTQHVVLQSERATVAGAGSKTFALTAPSVAEASAVLIAVWLGEDWRHPLAPIVTSMPIRLVTEAMAELEEKREMEAPGILRQLGWQRSSQGNIAILSDNMPGLDAKVVERYREALGASGAEVTPLSGEQLANPYVLSTDHLDMLVLVNAKVFPSPAIESLTRFLEAGGDLIVIGAPAFERLVSRVDGEWMDREQYLARLAETPPTRMLIDFEADEPLAFTRGADRPDSAYTVETAGPGASGTGKALHVRISDLHGWDTIHFQAPEGAFPQGSELTCFWAKGGARTTQLAFEWVEQDGSRWIATVLLATEWRPYALRPSEFRYWHDSPTENRGGPGDTVRPGSVRSLSVGLAMTHTQVSPGEHEYWIDQIGTAPDPFAARADWQAADPPVLDTISPAYKLYEVTAPLTSADMAAGRALLGDAALPLPGRMLSCHPRPQGTGFAKQRKWRWVPLVQVRGKDGEVAGTLATLMIHGTAPYRGSLWASITNQPEKYAAEDSVIGTVTRLARRMLQGVFLYEGGAEYYAYFGGEPIRLGATAANFGRAESGPLSVKITVRPEGKKQVIFEKEFGLSAAPGATQAVEAIWDRGEAVASDYSVTAELYRDGELVDALEHPVGIWRPKPQRKYMTAHDGDFYLGQRKWYPYGVNYMPSSECAIEDGEYFEYWLDPQPYDPVITERDLKRMKQIGFNMVSVFVYYRSIESRNLLDLLMRCEKHGLKVNLSLRPGTPLDFQWPEIGEIITQYRLATMDNIFAYDVAWEPMFRAYGQRKRWDREWEQWVIERYGSVGNAEQDWGMAIPRADGAVTSPSDEQVSKDGDWRVMVAAYRRFLDDMLSKTHLRAAQKVRTVDPHHLISFRMTIAGDPTAGAAAMAYDFRGLAKSMQIMEPEAYGRIGDWQRVLPGWFTEAYARYAAPGRPVMWAEFGYSVWDGATMGQSQARLGFAAQFYRDFLTLVLKSGGNGTVCWFSPGGYRWNERSDFGIISPDGTWREATKALHEFSPRMTQARDRPEPDVWLSVDRDADARGVQGIWAAVGERFLHAIEEGHVPGLRGDGEGLTSAAEPVVAVGNRPYNGHNPPKYLNSELNYLDVRSADGEWVRVEEDGQEVRVSADEPVLVRASIGNNGWATWLSPISHPDEPGGVYLTTTEPSALTFRQPIPADVPRFGDAVIPAFALKQQIREPTTLECVLLAEDRATFGERLEVRLAPGR